MPLSFTAETYEGLLRTGAFGPLRLGLGREAILQSLGPPDDVGRGMSRTEMLAYRSGHLQLTLAKGELVHFGVYFRGSSPTIQISDLMLSAGTTVSDLVEWMRRAGIHATMRSVSGGVHAQFDNGLVAVFEDVSLDSLQVS